MINIYLDDIEYMNASTEMTSTSNDHNKLTLMQKQPID